VYNCLIKQEVFKFLFACFFYIPMCVCDFVNFISVGGVALLG
jgi:hypothetical protein